MSKQTSAKPRVSTAADYTVVLQPGQPKEYYQGHLNFVRSICKDKPSAIASEPARITAVFRYPINDNVCAKYFAYTGKFSESIAQQIDRTAEKVTVMRDKTIPLAQTFKVSLAESWSLFNMSFDTDDAEQKAEFKAFPADQRTSSMFPYRGIRNRGSGSTIYVIDTGLHMDSLFGTFAEIDPGPNNAPRVEFYDAQEYLVRVTDKKLPTDTKTQRTTAAAEWQDHPLRDSDPDLHGTNVSLFAASQRRGVAPAARLVNFNCSVEEDRAWIDPVTNLPRTSRTYPVNVRYLMAALMRILEAGGDLSKAVVNCSFVARRDAETDPVLLPLFEELSNRGAHIVGAAGNAASGRPAAAVTVDDARPGALPYATCVGNITETFQRAADSNWAADANGPAYMIWAFGTALTGWSPSGPDVLTKEWPTCDGTSFSTPYVSGLIACLLADKTAPVTPQQLRTESNEYTAQSATGLRYLFWAQKKV